MTTRTCQNESIEIAVAPRARFWDLTLRGLEHLKQYGVMQTVGKILRFLSGRGDRKFSHANQPPSMPADTLDLAPGELVEVRSAAEIEATLDEEGKLRGLAFQPGMIKFCGQQFRVFKRLETLYDENSDRVRKVKRTVLLEGVYCDGLLMRCDRSCFYFWREAWLRRVPSN